jgi:hypothetical protein
MALTYGMIGDRLSDLVTELREINHDGRNSQKGRELSNIIDILNNLRSTCDALAMVGP